jgi:hypothetical protein
MPSPTRSLVGHPHLAGIVAVALLAALAAAACHRSTPAASGPAPMQVPASRAVITGAQIAQGLFTNAMEAVESLRANWLHQRGTDSFNNPGEVQVYLDNVRLGGIDTPRGIQANPSVSIRFISGLEASARSGLDHGHGVICISTSNQRCSTS